jgi:hypothetical protein
VKFFGTFQCVTQTALQFTGQRLCVSPDGVHLPCVCVCVCPDLKVDVVHIPGGMICQLQVLDVMATIPFKDHLCHLNWEWLLSGNYPLSTSRDVRQLSTILLGQWIKTAWSDILPESFVKGLKKYCILNSMSEQK